MEKQGKNISTVIVEIRKWLFLGRQERELIGSRPEEPFRGDGHVFWHLLGSVT
jgi:hypothetical protein